MAKKKQNETLLDQITTSSWFVNILVGIIIVGLTIYVFEIENMEGEYLSKIFGVIIIVISLYRFYRDPHKSYNMQCSIILLLELLYQIYVGGLLLFGTVFNMGGGSIPFCVGTALYARGFAYFLTTIYISGSMTKIEYFIVNIFFITAGCYMWFSGNAFVNELTFAIEVLLIVVGALFLLQGILQFLAKDEAPKTES